MSKATLLRIYFAFFCLFLPSLNLSAQGFCPGFNEETSVESGTSVEDSIARETVILYGFEASENDVWRFDVQADAILELNFYGPFQDETYTRDSVFTITTGTDRAFFSTAFQARFNAHFCLSVRNSRNRGDVDYQFTLSRLIERNGRFEGTEGITDPSGYNTIGNYYFSRGNYEAAYDYYLLAIDLDDNDYVLWGNLCSTTYYLGRYGEAIDSCNESLDLESPNTFALIYRSASFSALGLYAEAVDDCIELRELEPGNYYWAYALGINAIFLGDADEALDAMDDYVDLGSNPHESYWHGLAALNAEEYDDAIDDFQQSIGGSDYNPSYEYLWLGVVYMLLDDEAAEESLREGDTLIWQDESVWVRTRYLALSHLIHGNVDSSRSYYEDALAISAFSHDFIADRLYLVILTRLFPDEARYSEMLDWLNGELGIE